MKYYRMLDDLHFPGCWQLAEPVCNEDCDPSDFTAGRFSELSSIPIVEVVEDGVALDWTFAAFDVPIASHRLAEAMVRTAGAGLQRIPVRIGDLVDYAIMNATVLVECVDEERSEYLKWTGKDGRPDLVGEYRQVSKLVVDSARVPADAHVFRIRGWEPPLIVSATMKEAIDSLDAKGPMFQLVSL